MAARCLLGGEGWHIKWTNGPVTHTHARLQSADDTLAACTYSAMAVVTHRRASSRAPSPPHRPSRRRIVVVMVVVVRNPACVFFSWDVLLLSHSINQIDPKSGTTEAGKQARHT